MNQQFLVDLLENVKNGKTSIEDALTALRKFPYENVNDAVRLDHQRALRCGFPEMIFGAGKSEEQLVSIITQVFFKLGKSRQEGCTCRRNQFHRS